MMTTERKKELLCYLMEELLHQQLLITTIVLIIIKLKARRRATRAKLNWDMTEKMPRQLFELNRLSNVSDADCVANLRLDRNGFARLCFLLSELGGLKMRRYVGVEEQVAMFLSILAHHKKLRVVRFDFERSSQTVSRYFHLVLKAVLKLHHILLVKPTPIPEDETSLRWKWFKGCLGAVDGTYIDVQVPAIDKPKYRTRKGGHISTNVLGVCDCNMRFVYVLAGWEGSAADSRVLRDAIVRPHGLRVPKGKYYLADNGYPNAEGFLVPYRGVRYHLSEWGPTSGRPTTPHEHFNMRHTRARNVIERAFGVLKQRFGILRSPSFYPIKVQVRLITACFLLHNFARTVMPDDPVEMLEMLPEENDFIEPPEEMVTCLDSTPAFNQWRDYGLEKFNLIVCVIMVCSMMQGFYL